MTTEEDSRSNARGGATPQAHLVRLIDCLRPLEPSSRHGLRDLDLVLIGRGERGAERQGQERRLSLTEPDSRISTRHAQLRRVPGRWLVEDLGSRNGTFVNGETIRTAALNDGDLIEVGRGFFLFREGVPTPAEEPVDELAASSAPPGMVTLSPPLAHDLRALTAMTRSTVSVIIQGETGTGKELVARAVHALSARRGPFVAVNCGGIPPTLIESELFGVRRGAYSDAREDRSGFVRSADGGTLFLDEIGDLPLAVQAAFLRVLQEREVVPIGQVKPVRVDLRVVSASHRSLEELVARGAFREDLLARLHGFAVRLPPLRERREDLGLLIAALIRRMAAEPERVTFHPDAMRALLRSPWQRNARELEKALEAALVLAGAGPIHLGHLGHLSARSADEVSAPETPEDAAIRLELERLLAEHLGNLSAVARAMGKDRVQVRRWLKRLKLDPARYKR